MPSWHRAPSDPYYPTSEAEAPTHWVPRLQDFVLLAIAAGLFLIATILDDDEPREPAPITTTTQTQEGTNL